MWLVDLCASGEQHESALALLSHAERARARAIRGEQARRRFVLARAALRVRLADVLGIAPELVALRIGEHGKPEIAPALAGGLRVWGRGKPEIAPVALAGGLRVWGRGKPEIVTPPPGAEVGGTHVSQGLPRFNLSHGDGAALLAINHRWDDVGIDIERIAPESERPWRKLLERICHPSEAREAMVEARTIGSRAFYERWVGKEAVLKALGPGLRVSPADVSLRRDSGGALRVEELPGRGSARGGELEVARDEVSTRVDPGLSGWRLAAVPTPAGFVGAVALVDR